MGRKEPGHRVLKRARRVQLTLELSTNAPLAYMRNAKLISLDILTPQGLVADRPTVLQSQPNVITVHGGRDFIKVPR